MRLAELGRWCFRHRRTVALAWVLALVGIGSAAATVGGRFVNDFAVARSEAQDAFELLEARFPELNGDLVQVVVVDERGAADPAVRAEVEAMLAEFGRAERVQRVLSPYGGGGAISEDGRVALALVQMDALGPDLPRESVQALIGIADAHRAGLGQVELGGPSVQFAESELFGSRELVGLAAAVVILLVTFGSVTAMSLPILVAALGLGVGLAGVTLLTHVVSIFTFATPLAVMIGLGVGIDYALFIVTRYRQALTAGRSPEDAAAVAVATSGRAVIFAGLTVMISVLGMVLMGISFANGMAFATALVVLCTVVAAVTATPAALGFVGTRIDALRVPRLGRSATPSGRWQRWSEAVQRRRGASLLAGCGLLVVLALPLSDMRLGGPQLGSDPPERTSRRAYDLVTDAFGPGTNGPLLLVADGPPGSGIEATLAAAVDRARQLGADAGIPPLLNAAGDTGVATVVPPAAPHEESTERLVQRLRDDVIPEVTDGGPVTIRVGGVTALFIDMSALVAERLPLFVGGVLLLSFVLLMAVFRSLLVPVKAVLANLLSIGAAYGVVTAVFQWGWLADVVGVERTGPVMAFLPMMLFAILFGLSMDYEVFLMSRIHEAHELTGDPHAAINEGITSTGRVITAAAAIMVTLFASFVLGDDIIIKTFGLGLAVAVLLDATVVRMLIVPAAMAVFGGAAWWLPSRLDRLLPRVEVEGDTGAG
ncbi:MAG TPA: MMPL family transporter [Acidimicrobiales bacterium]|nr:MMPL family transporter [Acidimicrobiales bacterium]